MTPKEYLKQAYRLNKRIDDRIKEKAELYQLAVTVSSTTFEEKISSGTRNNEAPFVRNLEKCYQLEAEIDAEIDKFVDLKRQMRGVIDELTNVDEKIVLINRYLLEESWDKIAENLHADVRTVFRWHSKALENLKLPDEPIVI